MMAPSRGIAARRATWAAVVTPPEAITAAGTAPARAASSSKLGSVRVLSRVMSVQMKRTRALGRPAPAPDRPCAARRGPSSPGWRPRRRGASRATTTASAPRAATSLPHQGRSLDGGRPQHHPAGPRREGGLRRLQGADPAPQLQAYPGAGGDGGDAPHHVPVGRGPVPGAVEVDAVDPARPVPHEALGHPSPCPGRPSPWRSPLEEVDDPAPSEVDRGQDLEGGAAHARCRRARALGWPSGWPVDRRRTQAPEVGVQAQAVAPALLGVELGGHHVVPDHHAGEGQPVLRLPGHVWRSLGST